MLSETNCYVKKINNPWKERKGIRFIIYVTDTQDKLCFDPIFYLFKQVKKYNYLIFCIIQD